MIDKIRRLTPKEALRLMDANPDFIEKVISSKKISDTQLYKMAGNSIVVRMWELILKQLLHI